MRFKKGILNKTSYICESSKICVKYIFYFCKMDINFIRNDFAFKYVVHHKIILTV